MPDRTFYEQAARAAAQRHGIDPNIFHAQIRQESGFDPTARSGAGALGIAQIVPRWHPGVDPLDPLAALDYAAKHDATLLKKYGGDWRQTLSVYNSGRPDKWADPQFSGGQTYNYVRNILGAAPQETGTPPAAAAPTLSNVKPATPDTAAGASAPAASSSSLLLSLIAANQQGAGLPGISPLLLTLAQPTAQEAYQPSVPRPPIIKGPQPAQPKIEVQGNVTQRVKGAVGLIQQYLGTPYSWGGGNTTGPTKGIGRGANTVGFDCSSLLQFVWAKQGIEIPRVTYDQWKVGAPVPKSQLRPGDAVFFRPGSRGPEHVGMFIGGGKFVEAPGTGKTVRISDLAGRGDFMGGRRYG